MYQKFEYQTRTTIRDKHRQHIIYCYYYIEHRVSNPLSSMKHSKYSKVYTDEDEHTTLIINKKCESTINPNRKLIPINLPNFIRRLPPNNRSRKRQYTSWAVLLVTSLFLLLLLYIPLFDKLQIDTVTLPGWSQNTSRNISYYVLPKKNTTLIQPVNVCSKKLLLLIVVCSSVENFEIRRAIRETWGNITEFNYSFFAKLHERFQGRYLTVDSKNYKSYIINNPADDVDDGDDDADDSGDLGRYLIKISNSGANYDDVDSRFDESSQYNYAIRIVFLLGLTSNENPDGNSNSNETQLRINQESEEYGDVIQESFVDSYNNLTLKTIMMLKWVNLNCLNKVKFLMKCDDDTFVNIPNLLHVLLGGTVPIYKATIQEYDRRTIKVKSSINRLKQDTNLLLGYRFCYSKPVVNVTSKWYSPVYMYSGKTYPIYLSGTGYVMSTDIAIKLYKASFNIPLFHLEDVYITGICAASIKIKPRNHHLFSYTSYKNPCELKGMITKHQLSTVNNIREIYEFVTNTSVFCAEPDSFWHNRKQKVQVKNC